MREMLCTNASSGLRTWPSICTIYRHVLGHGASTWSVRLSFRIGLTLTLIVAEILSVLPCLITQLRELGMAVILCTFPRTLYVTAISNLLHCYRNLKL